jgi:hypothetical protein
VRFGRTTSGGEQIGLLFEITDGEQFAAEDPLDPVAMKCSGRSLECYVLAAFSRTLLTARRLDA